MFSHYIEIALVLLRYIGLSLKNVLKIGTNKGVIRGMGHEIVLKYGDKSFYNLDGMASGEVSG